MLVVFVLSPFLGALTDQAPSRRPFLALATVLCVAATFTLGTEPLVFSLAAFALANVAYQAGLQFYDALLPSVSTVRNRGRIGGYGIGAGYVGALIGLVVGMWRLSGVDALPFGDQSVRYREVFRLSATLFLLLALPCLLFVRDRTAARAFRWRAFPDAASRVVHTFRTLPRHGSLLRFLVARLFYADAVNTVIAFLGIYVTNEVGFSTAESQIVLLVAILCSAAGGFVWGRIVDRRGALRTLRDVLSIWMLVFLATAAIGLFDLPGFLFWPVAATAGFALAGTWTSDRPLMLALMPAERVGESFGLYGMASRFAAITGPLLWALVADQLGLGRPAAVASLLLFVFVGRRLLGGVRFPEAKESAA